GCATYGRTWSENCHVLPPERGKEFANAHGDNSSERSTNGRAARGDGRKITYGDADCGSFGCGDETSCAAEREDSRDPRERRASAQPRGSAATGQTIRRDSRLESKQIARGAVRERDRCESDVG